MSDPLRATLSSNAGVIFEYRGSKLLVDGIYGEKGHPFSNLGADRWHRMVHDLPPYDNISYLLFTHLHPDHFDPDLTLSYLKQHPVKGIFMPDDAALENSPLLTYIKEQRIPCVMLSARTNRSRFQIEPEIEVQAFAVPHLDRKYWDVPHYCYLLTCGEKRVLLTADADYTRETFSNLKDVPLQAAFVNPLFFSALRHDKFFKGVLQVETICVYHVPFSEDDTMRMRTAIAQDLLTWPGEKPEAVVLCYPNQFVEL